MGKSMIITCDLCGGTSDVSPWEIKGPDVRLIIDLCPRHQAPIAKMVEQAEDLGIRNTARRNWMYEVRPDLVMGTRGDDGSS